jgi:hypothetical protein
MKNARERKISEYFLAMKMFVSIEANRLIKKGASLSKVLNFLRTDWETSLVPVSVAPQKEMGSDRKLI